MKKKYSYPFIFVLLLLCVSFLFPCFASAAVDYNDYISNVVVDGSNDLVTCTIPSNDVHWAVVRSGVNYFSGDGASFVTRQPLPAMALADIYSSWFYNDPLILSNIPNQTSISGTYHFDLDFSPASNANLDYNYSLVIHYLDSAGKHLSYDTIVSERYQVPAIGVLGTTFDENFSFSLDKPDGAAFAYFETRFYFYAGHTGAVTISGSVSDLTMNMSISSLYRLQQQTGKTNQLLEEVEHQLDHAINGDVDSDIPEGGDIVGDLGNLEDNLFDSVSGGLDAADSVFATSSSFLYSLAPAFVFVASMCNDLWSFGPFGNLLQVSLGLGVGAAILGLGFSALRSLREPRFHGFIKAKKKGE